MKFSLNAVRRRTWAEFPRDFERIWKSKRALSARPLAEKLRMLDALRQRAVALHAAGSQPAVKAQEQPPPYSKPH